MLKKILLSFILLTGVCSSFAQGKGDLFPVPEVPSDLTSLQERSDYIITHFWDHLNVKSILSAKQKFSDAFDTYVDLMPLGSRRTVVKSIYSLLGQLQNNPKELLFVAEQAEALLYSDTARVRSDEAYIHFARAIAENKKLGRAEKARFVEQARILSECNVGMPAPELTFTDSAGVNHTIAEAADTASYTILFFNDPDCVDCIIARGRLSANHTVNKLVAEGILKIIAITPNDASAQWKAQVSRYPADWIVGAAPDAPSKYDLRSSPCFYILDNKLKIVSKDTPIDDIISLFNRML